MQAAGCASKHPRALPSCDKIASLYDGMHLNPRLTMYSIFSFFWRPSTVVLAGSLAPGSFQNADQDASFTERMSFYPKKQ
jgi:hypothetical protein